MFHDEIVEEIHRIREEYAKSFNYDLKAIFADLQKQQAESGREFVTLSRKPIIFLKLYFEEIDRLIGCIRQKDSIETKGQLFNFHRGELIRIGGFGGKVQQIKETSGKSLQELIENTVSFHTIKLKKRPLF